MRKTINAPRRQATRVFVPDFSGGINSVTDSRVLPFSHGEAAWNVSVESGALKNGYGVTATAIPAAYEKIFYYKVYKEDTQTEQGITLAYKTDKKVYGSTDGATWREILGVTFQKPPMGVNYRLYGEDVFLLCGEEGMAVVDENLQAVTVPTAPSVTSLAMHNERMFVTIGGRKNAIWFSDDLDPTNWNPDLDEGGFIELEGEQGRLNKAVAFGGYVYVFCDYGIVRLSALGDQSDFSVTNLFVSSGRIYGDTVAACGDRVLFLASDGMYSFNGLVASRICRSLDGIFGGGAPCACYSAGKYYLATKSADSAGENDLLIVIDPRTKAVSVSKGIYVKRFSPLTEIGGERLLVCTDKAYIGEVRKGQTYYGESLRKVWRSGMSDLGAPDRRKIVTEVCLDTAFDCTVTVRTEKGSKTLAFAGKNEAQRKRVNLVGTKVQMEISATGDISAARPVIKFTALT